MKTILKILGGVVISIIGLGGLVALALFIYFNLPYNWELNKIKKELNDIENVHVVNIWGHKDVTLEEISARLEIKGKGELVLYGLSHDVFNYPEKVPVTEIGEYSFTRFTCRGGIGPGIDIGTEGELGKFFDMKFETVEDIVAHYDKIIETIESLKHTPEINHFGEGKSELFLLIHKRKTKDEDPIKYLYGIERKAEFAKTLDWINKDCYYGKKE